jgi:hypothetical protein
MAASPEEICNIALLRAGCTETIDSLAESTEEAEAANVHYGPARDALLEEFSWPFATRRATLALSTETRTGWDYVYDLPGDCLAPRSIVGEFRTPGEGEEIPFAVELSDDGSTKLLLTDQENAVLSYTSQVESVGLFSPLFVDALAWRLASEFALALPVKPQVGMAMKQGYEAALLRAGASMLRQSKEDAAPDSEFIRER